MAPTSNQRRAADAVAARMAHLEWNNTQLVAATGADPGTIGDFLNGKRWPKLGTQGKIERAIGWPPGTLRAIAAGSPAPRADDGAPTSAQTVGGGEADVVRFRRPEGLTDLQWARIRESAERYLAFEIHEARRENS